MAHMVETMAYAGETPWHGLGVAVSNDLTPVQMMEKAGLDWTVEKVDSYVRLDGQEIPTGQQSLIRSSDNRILTNVGPDWNPVQNEEAFEFFSEYVFAGDMEMHTAGSLKDGRMVWALAKVKESFDILGGDQVDSYLLFSNPHEYGKSIDVRFTPIRVVCNNTLTMSLQQQAKSQVKINHRSKFNADMVKETLGIAHEKFAKYKEMAQFLGSKRYTEEKLKEYFAKVFPVLVYNKEKGPQRKEISKSASRALLAIHTQPGAKFAEGSWWQAFNTVTYLTDHEIGKTADSRLTSAWYGPNKNLKIKALETAVEYAEAA